MIPAHVFSGSVGILCLLIDSKLLTSIFIFVLLLSALISFLYIFIFKLSSVFLFISYIKPTARSIRSLLASAPFGVRDFIYPHIPCLDVKRFQSMFLDGDRNWLYNTRHGVICLSVAGRWVRHWKDCDSRKAVLRYDVRFKSA